MSRHYLLATALNGFLAVAFGAFGAHALEARLGPELLHTWQTAVQYQMFHSLGLLAVALWKPDATSSAALRWSGRLFLAGIVLFCGSLYLLALTNVRILGAVTPIGGVAWLAAWMLLGKVALSSTTRTSL
jgi:uncharacterized membrane protein YgdD (TMEM256/DUF423 family)